MMLDCFKEYISDVERGKAHMCLATIEALAKGLKCEAWEIVTRGYDYLESNNAPN